LTLGAPATSAPVLGGGGFTFATPTSTTATSSTGTGLLGATTLSSGLSGFGTAAASSAPTSSAPTLSFGTVNTLGGPAATTAATGFSFGPKPAATTATTGGLFGSLGGLTTSATTTAPTTANVTTAGGLGGVLKHSGSGADSSFAFGSGSGDGKSESRALQELPIPAELHELVEGLKNQIKAEKVKFTEVSKANNDTYINKVSEEIEEVRALAANVASLIQKQNNSAEALRNLVYEGIANAEMAVQTKETPLTSQMDHTTPMRFFFRLIESYRERMHIFLREIEKAESSLSYVVSAQGTLTSKDLFSALKATQDSTIALSAKIQILHEELGRVEEAHRNFQRYLLGESADLNATANRAHKMDHLAQRNKDEPINFKNPTMLFPHRMVEPAKIVGFNATQPFSTPTKPTGVLPTMAYTSTPNRSVQQSHGGPPDFFQTQQSTLLGSTQLGSSILSPSASLKRSKNCI